MCNSFIVSLSRHNALILASGKPTRKSCQDIKYQGNIACQSIVYPLETLPERKMADRKYLTNFKENHTSIKLPSIKIMRISLISVRTTSSTISPNSISDISLSRPVLMIIASREAVFRSLLFLIQDGLIY